MTQNNVCWHFFTSLFSSPTSPSCRRRIIIRRQSMQSHPRRRQCCLQPVDISWVCVGQRPSQWSGGTAYDEYPQGAVPGAAGRHTLCARRIWRHRQVWRTSAKPILNTSMKWLCENKPMCWLSYRLLDPNNSTEIANYPIYKILFCVRGHDGTPESDCFAFTESHYNAEIFRIHVFRCQIQEAVSI